MLAIEEELKQLQILVRTNNLLLSRFVMQLAQTRKELGLPKRNVFFKFSILQEDYEALVVQFGKQEVDKALYRLDRTLLLNKQQCPHNIKTFITKEIERNIKSREKYRNDKEKSNNIEQE